MEDFPSNAQIHANSLRVALTLFLILSLLNGFGQVLSTTNKKASKLYLKADKKYRERDFEGAISLLEEAVSKDAIFSEAFLRMGNLYQVLGQEDSVYAKYTTYLKVTKEPVSSILERMAHMAFDKGHYEKAENYLSAFLKKIPEKGSDRKVELLVRSLEFVKTQLHDSKEIQMEVLPQSINKYKLQYLPTSTVDGQTLIYTKRDHHSDDEDIVFSQKVDGVWTPAQPISEKINTPFNEGACTVSADGRTMIFTACDRKDSFGSCDLYFTKKVGHNWSKPKNLGSTLNSIYWESQPSLSADGKQLYFSSNRPGGYGGRDIWVSEFAGNQWQRPRNVGKEINSFMDETTPFIHVSGNTLFFSSNGHPGMGGYDLFSTVIKDTLWAIPNNLGYPINTHKDEVALLVTADGTQGYFAKEQVKNQEILDSRLVSLQLPESVRPTPSSYIIGKILDEKTKKSLKAEVEVVDVDTNEKLYSSSSDSLTGEYYMVLPQDRELAGYIKKKGYLFKGFSFQSAASSFSNPDTIIVTLSPLFEGANLILNNIYFGLDSYELGTRSISGIEHVIELLKENPAIRVEISGHTDDIGEASYNQLLSERRARAVYDELIKRGIPPECVTYKGYGHTQPLVPNDTNSNRESNRRIEFRVIRL